MANFEKPPEGYKVDNRFIEKKTRRLQLIMQPSLYERIIECAEKAGLSRNDFVHQALDNVTKEYLSQISQKKSDN